MVRDRHPGPAADEPVHVDDRAVAVLGEVHVLDPVAVLELRRRRRRQGQASRAPWCRARTGGRAVPSPTKRGCDPRRRTRSGRGSRRGPRGPSATSTCPAGGCGAGRCPARRAPTAPRTSGWRRGCWSGRSRAWPVSPRRSARAAGSARKNLVRQISAASRRAMVARYQLPWFGIDAQGSCLGSAGPRCSSSTEWPSGDLMNAMWPSRGGRRMATPASRSRAHVA